MPIKSRGILSPQRARRRARHIFRRISLWTVKVSRWPFPRLVQHFLVRLIRGGDSTSSEFQFGIGPLLGLLIAPGAFQSLMLLDKYSVLLSMFRGQVLGDLLTTSASDKYTILSIAMGVTGVVAVLKWDRILLDSQDYLNLAPLPIRPWTVLLANAAAISIAAAVLAVAVNGASMALFPMLITAAAPPGAIGFAPFVGIHSLCVILASLFAFCGVFAALGTTAALLPPAFFQTWSSWVRAILLVGFIALLLSGFAGPALLRQLRVMPDSAVRWLPPMWYLSLYQSLQHRATPEMARLVPMALWGLGAALGLMAVSYGLSYRRRFASVLEGLHRSSDRRLLRFLLAFFDCFATRRAGFERAIYRFVIRALLQNDAQRLCVSVSLGLGWLFASQAVAVSAAVLAAPLMMAYLLLAGLRLAYEIPATVPASWIFQSIADPREQETRGIARQVMLAFLILLVLLPCFAFSWWWVGLLFATLHTLYVLALSLCLMEILLSGYRKIPFTCFMPGFRESLPVLCLLHLLGFAAFAHLGARLEQWLLTKPPRFLLVPAVMLAVWLWNRKRIKDAKEAGELESGISFDGRPSPAIERLRLSDSD